MIKCENDRVATKVRRQARLTNTKKKKNPSLSVVNALHYFTTANYDFVAVVVIDTMLCTQEEIDALTILQTQLKEKEIERQAQLAAQGHSPQQLTEMVCI